jgi:hypothetical protein
MSSSPADGKPGLVQKVNVSDDFLTVDLTDGRTVSVPTNWFPRLSHGSEAERRNWRLIGRGEGIHWPDLDEDISVESLLAGRADCPGDSNAREAFFRAMWPLLRSQGLVPEMEDDLDPVRRWERLKFSHPAKAAASLHEAARDLLEMTQDLSGPMLERIDAHLRDRGAPTLTAMRLGHERYLARLLRRGRIERTEEYRALMSRLNDVADAGLQGEDRTIASRMVSEFEQRSSNAVE